MRPVLPPVLIFVIWAAGNYANTPPRPPRYRGTHRASLCKRATR